MHAFEAMALGAVPIARQLGGGERTASGGHRGAGGRGLHPFTFQLNVSAFYGTGGARKGYVPRV